MPIDHILSEKSAMPSTTGLGHLPKTRPDTFESSITLAFMAVHFPEEGTTHDIARGIFYTSSKRHSVQVLASFPPQEGENRHAVQLLVTDLAVGDSEIHHAFFDAQKKPEKQ